MTFHLLAASGDIDGKCSLCSGDIMPLRIPRSNAECKGLPSHAVVQPWALKCTGRQADLK